MNKTIEKLTLHNFRGASGKCEIVFDTAKSLVMIFGENGTGKSTIVDAIDFIANSTIGSLEDRSVGSQGHSYLPTITKKPSELKIELASQRACLTGTLSGRSLQVTGGSGTIRAHVLRRARLLQLVEAQPAKRYEVLQGFLDVTKVETSEQKLRDAARNTEDSLKEAIAVLEDATRALADLWAKEGSPENSAKEWAKKKSAVDQTSVTQRGEHLKSVTQSLESVVAKRKELDDALCSVTDCTDALQEIDKEIVALPDVGGAQAVELVRLLEQAQTIVAEPNNPDKCPVCEQPVVAADLRKSISDRLSRMASHRSLAKKRTQADRNLSTAKTAYSTAVSAYIKAVRAAASKAKVKKHAPASAASVSWQKHEAFLQDTAVGGDHLPAAKAVEDQLTAIQPAYQQDCQSAQTDLNQYNAIKGHYDRIINNRDRAEKLDALHKRLKLALEICEDIRRKFTQAVLDDVEGEVNRLYSIIHPNEPLGPLRLSMNPNRRGSVEQDATFAGQKQVPPQAYFSESHLDTLGFCVWLALAKRDRPQETVIVLDDVFTSVDGVHLTRIMHLLTDIVKDFAQLIVTTHYRTWRDRYRLPLGPGLIVQLLELHRWSLERGVCLSGTKLAVQELETALRTQPLDRQAVASQAGILLEAVFDRLTLQYRRRVPRTRDGDLTLGDLLGSCKKLFDVLTVEKTLPSDSVDPPPDQPTVKAVIQPFFQDTGPWVFIRNQVGCHFNFSGAEVVDADVEAFGEATVSLVKAITCLNCGDIPDRADGTHFRCGCRQTKMTPLEYDK